MKHLTVLPDERDARLDRVLGRILPDMGLRGRRRLCELGLVHVNGRPASPACKMREGDTVEILDHTGPTSPPSFVNETLDRNEKHTAAPDSLSGTDSLFPEDKARLVIRTPHLAVICKPAAMHTEALAGKPGISLQSLLPTLLGSETDARLLNRLDYPTSGLTVAAIDDEGERQYREAQEKGLTTKRYLALLEGRLSHDMYAAQKLLLKNRSRVLVELADHPDRRRHTAVHPLAVMDPAPLFHTLKLKQHGWTGHVPSVITLAGCTILKGARHQIRAHCSSLGFPLLGDGRYGASLHPEDHEAFFLHHARLSMPGLDALALPVWLDVLGIDAVNAAAAWLKR